MSSVSFVAKRRALLAAYHSLTGTPGVSENQVNTRHLEQRPDALKRVEKELRKCVGQITWKDRLAASTNGTVLPLPVFDDEDGDTDSSAAQDG